MTGWKVLKTEEEYKKALAMTIELFHTEEGTPEAEELGLLLVLVKDYEERKIQLPSLN